MTIQAVAAAYNRHQASIAHRATIRTAAQWAGIDPGDISGSWSSAVGPAMTRTLTAAQQLAAASAPTYVRAALGAQNAAYDPQATINPTAFSGTAADGRSLSGLLYLPVIDAKTAIASGMGVADALARAGRMLDRLVASESAQAGRDALAAQMSATPTVEDYVRMVAGSACSRCIILAGKKYKKNAGFARHPKCQCTGIPCAENTGDDLRTDPHALFNSLSPAEQDARFGTAGADAIRRGGDIFQVVNSQRGIYTADVFGRRLELTKEGVTKRGLAGRRLIADRKPGAPTGFRLSVGEIYRAAGDDDGLLTSLLYKYGFIR